MSITITGMTGGTGTLTVSGTGPANSNVQVAICDGYRWIQKANVPVNASGSWSTTFTEVPPDSYCAMAYSPCVFSSGGVDVT